MCRERFGKLLALGDRAGRRWEKQRKVRVTALVWDGVMRWRWLGQVENGIIFDLNMSGEMHMDGRQDARMRYSAAYPTGAERIVSG